MIGSQTASERLGWAAKEGVWDDDDLTHPPADDTVHPSERVVNSAFYALSRRSVDRLSNETRDMLLLHREEALSELEFNAAQFFLTLAVELMPNCISWGVVRLCLGKQAARNRRLGCQCTTAPCHAAVRQ